MPQTQFPVIGVEFVWQMVSNGDGGTLTLYTTVTNAQEHFTVRAEHTGPVDGTGGILTIKRPIQGDIVIDIQPGSRALITLQESVAIALPWSQVFPRCQLQGGFRTAAARRGRK